MAEDTATVKRTLEDLSKRVAQLEKAHVKQQGQLRELEILHGVALSLSDELDVDKTLEKFRDFLLLHFNDTKMLVLLSDHHNSQMSIAISDLESPLQGSIAESGCERGVFAEMLRSGKGLYIANTKTVDAGLSFLHQNQVSSWLFFPLKAQRNARLGIMGLARNGDDAFPPAERDLFKKVAGLLGSILNKVLLFYHTKELSITDPLTRLYNRRYLNERLEEEVQRAKRYGHQLTVLIIDIDYFKHYNDINGHLEGDEALKRLAELFQDNTRHADIVSRFGGEEFVILLPEIDFEHGRLAAEKIRTKIEKASFPGEGSLPAGNLTISIGFATYPRDAQSAKEILDLADRALYISKERGRNRVSHLSDKDAAQKN